MERFETIFITDPLHYTVASIGAGIEFTISFNTSSNSFVSIPSVDSSIRCNAAGSIIAFTSSGVAKFLPEMYACAFVARKMARAARELSPSSI